MATESTNAGRHCIWCGSATSGKEPLEHIVPEALGCPEDFILRDGEVCGSCNNGLGHVDQALIHDLEVCAFMANVPRKRGRPPKVSSYGNFQAEVADGKATYLFNMDPTPVVAGGGKHLAGFRGKERDINARMQRDARVATIDFPLEFGRSPKFWRALVKLGAEYLCWAMGRDSARRAITGAVAQYVLKGVGYRPVIVFDPDASKYQHHFGHIGATGDGEMYCVFRLAHFSVMVDLTSDLSAFEKFARGLHKLRGTQDWFAFPRDAVSDQNGELTLRMRE